MKLFKTSFFKTKMQYKSFHSSKKTIKGHLFIAKGDLRKLSLDAWLITAKSKF